jgi:hypothetical protein
MPKETQTTVTPPGREFAIPVDLLKTFNNDIRTLPHVNPSNGYIIFDRKMLVSVLRGNDVEKRMEVAKHLEKLGNVGGALVIMQQ